MFEIKNILEGYVIYYHKHNVLVYAKWTESIFPSIWWKIYANCEIKFEIEHDKIGTKDIIFRFEMKKTLDKVRVPEAHFWNLPSVWIHINRLL